jgi:hypothetical protein
VYRTQNEIGKFSEQRPGYLPLAAVSNEQISHCTFIQHYTSYASSCSSEQFKRNGHIRCIRKHFEQYNKSQYEDSGTRLAERVKISVACVLIFLLFCYFALKNRAHPTRTSQQPLQSQVRAPLSLSVLINYRTEVYYAAYNSAWCNHQIDGGFC